ncbi:MAG TPA: ADP-forming succinate--CoA ligase subunit beta [Nitrospirota bacterium]
MKLQEYQAKELLNRAGMPVPDGEVVTTPDEAAMAFERLDAEVAVIKAQVLTGGRGKAGGVQTVYSADEAKEAALRLLGKRLVTEQSGPDGVVVKNILVEEGLTVEKEYYVAVTIDREKALPVAIVSASGGMEIEEVSRTQPEKVFREYIEPVFGLQPYQARKLAYRMGLEHSEIAPFVDALLKLHVIFLVNELELAEVNPLVKTEDGELVALDAKITIDDNALFRQEDLQFFQDSADIDPLEARARAAGVNYIKLKGNIGCMVNGAGLAMATMDLIKACGGEPANFLDVGGGAGKEKIRAALGILVADPQVEAVLINIFGGILRCDVLAEGIAEAAKTLDINVPLVVRLEGTNREEGIEILKQAGLGITFARGMREAGEVAVSFLRSNA